jgi:PAS domain S-box-containing protein
MLQVLKAESYVGTTLLGYDGRPIGLIAVIGRKPLTTPARAEAVLKLVSFRAAGELERLKAEEAVRSSELRYRSYIEVTGALGWTTNANGEVTEDLPAWRMYTGQTQQEILGSGWSQALHPDDAPRAAAAWQQAVADRHPYEVEYRVRRHDGVYRHFLVRGAPVLLDDGSVREWVGACIDITGRKQAEVELQRLSDELQRSNVDLEQFAAVVAHDLQEPLRAVTGFASLLQSQYQGRLDEKADSFLAGAFDGTVRMQQLIDDLLAYSRVATSGEARQPLQADEALDTALANLSAALDESGAVVTRDPLPQVIANRTQFVQLLQNLVGNAIKFRGEAVPAIHVSAARQEEHWIFSVRDNGIGIGPAKARIFAIFQRLHPRGKYPGTGVGLAICKRIVERHGGRIWVESQLGHGATFFFTLPQHATSGLPSATVS